MIGQAISKVRANQSKANVKELMAILTFSHKLGIGLNLDRPQEMVYDAI